MDCRFKCKIIRKNRKFQNVGLGEEFLGKTSKAQSAKRHIDTLNCIKIKRLLNESVCSAKDC